MSEGNGKTISVEEIEQLLKDYKRAMDGLLKIDHIISAFLAVSSPSSRPYAEVLLAAVKEARGELTETEQQSDDTTKYDA